MAASLHVRIVSPETTVYEGEASALVLPAWDGKVGVLAGHAPMITLLGAGELEVHRRGAEDLTYYVERGVLKVEGDEVVVLTDRAEPEIPEEGLPRDAVMHPEELDVVEDVTPWNPMA